MEAPAARAPRRKSRWRLTSRAVRVARASHARRSARGHSYPTRCAERSSFCRARRSCARSPETLVPLSQRIALRAFQQIDDALLARFAFDAMEFVALLDGKATAMLRQRCHER